MKTDLTTTGSFAQTQALTKPSNTKNLVPKPILSKIPLDSSPDYKLDLSTGARASIPALPSVPLPSLSTPELSLPEAPKEVSVDPKKDRIKLEEIRPEIKAGSLKKAGIFFIKGLDVFSSPSKSEGGYAGVGRIAESVEGSRLYGWDQKEDIKKEIKKIHPDYPVILIGHSLGGDTAIEIADELDGLKEGFRKVDLLVTIDAVGFSHDIIPQNVKKHLNVFGEKDLFLNDGPHVARREEKTSVRNILSPHDHTDIDDDREIQFEVVSLIQDTLKNGPHKA